MAGLKGKISKSEKITIGLLVAAALVIAGIWVYGEIQKAQIASETQSFQEANQASFSMGETIHLSAEEDASAIDENGDAFEAVFPWETGAMDLTIDSAALYESPTKAGMSKDDITFESALKKPFVLLKATLKNVDAVPQIYDDEESEDEEDGLYNVSFLSISGGELCYFDGTSPKAGEKGAFEFELEPGEEKQVTLGYCVHEEDQLDNVLNVGIVPGKYWVYLDVDDKRQEA